MIISVVGQYGSGKTLFMTRDAVTWRLKNKAKILSEEHHIPEEAFMWETHRKDFPTLIEFAEWIEAYPTEREDQVAPIISTYPLNGVKSYCVTIAELIALIKEGHEEELTGSRFLMDEAHLYLESRRSGSKLNLFLTDQFLDWSRKLRMTVYLTTQFWEKVDVRARQATGVYIACTELGDGQFRLIFKHVKSGRQKKYRYNGTQIYPFYDTTYRPKAEGKSFKFQKDYFIP